MSEAKTKAKEKMKVQEKLYVPLSFTNNTYPGCCGALVPCGFVEQTEKRDWYVNKTVKIKPEFATREEQANDAITKWEDYGINNLYWYVTLTLVWKYRDGVQGENGIQLPHLHEALVKRGYKIESEFVAPRHGNTLRVYTKLLDNKGEDYYEAELNTEDDDWDDDGDD